MVSGVNGLPGENVIWNVSMVWWMARACAEGIVTALGQCMGGGSVLEFLNMKRSVALQYAQVYVCILFHLLSEQLIWYYGRTLTFNLHSFIFHPFHFHSLQECFWFASQLNIGNTPMDFNGSLLSLILCLPNARLVFWCTLNILPYTMVKKYITHIIVYSTICRKMLIGIT